MDSYTKQLNHVFDIGGICTLNNFYSPNASTYKGSLLYIRKLFRSYIAENLLEKIEPIGKPANKSHEVFYCLTRKGAQYIGRANEYKYKRYQKSPYNVMHESMKFDIALSFLRLFPTHKFTFTYNSSFYGVRPDILVRIDNDDPNISSRFLLIEIERKKTVDRVFHEKIRRYGEMFKTIEQNKSHNLKHYRALFVYTDIWYNVFLRLQQYNDPQVCAHIERVNRLLKHLIYRYCNHLPDSRYGFMAFHDFYRLNQPVWYTAKGYRVLLGI